MVAIDMEMPKSCAECLFMSYSECLLNDEYIMDTAERDNDCPLKEIREAKNMAIKALEQEPCEDAVSRQAVSYIIKSHIHEIITESGTDKNAHTNAVLRAIVNLVETMPPVTPTTCIAKVTFDKDELQKIVDESVKEMIVERKKGKWIEEPNCWLRCSCCKSHYPHTSINGVRGSNYCPNCGADMREVEE
jgi:Zn finger protein HypA/HybF involved in hydrogenase expression